ncbi:hypothetical protein PL381_05025 [Bifidobacterium adolescentis]|nr:hypothetical protein [Bifidobacterium adolescentis]MDB0591662.1 hypothetical protein [Bifidobacterium adolescentis]MDB0595536.1 hypothetical protein [Bifidobacterium adolescentis]MDB0604442.1 hypothetical protein [Bifidobacterium adolescentis]MDB0619154.1 hypothetical protein [Bifidobacterium adolescentis]
MDEKARSTQAQNRCGPVVIGVAAAATVVLAVGGVCGYRAYEGHQVSVARQTCQSAAADLGKAVKTYKTLLGSDDTMAALKTDAKSVKDARTVDTLAKAAKAKLPAMVRCDASTVAGLDASAARASKAAKAVKAVETSKLDKTVDDAEALYKATDGKVQDDKTRDALAKAVKSRDAAAIAKAVKAVNESKAAKEKADAEAKAKVEQEAQAASGGSQSAGGSGYSSSSYSGGTASAGRSSGSTGGWSYSGGASGGSASSGNGGGASGGNGGSTSGMPYIPSTSTGHGSYGEDSNGNWHDDFTPDPNEGGEVWW